MLRKIEAGRLATGAEYRGEVSSGHSRRDAPAEGPNDERQRNVTKRDGNASDDLHQQADSSYTRHQHWRARSRAKRNPAWLESVLRHCRSAESSARDRQMGTTQVALLSLGTMGIGRRPGTAQARRHSARSVEYQQIGSWSMAAVEDTGISHCATIALLRNHGTTQPCATVGIQFIEPPDT